MYREPPLVSREALELELTGRLLDKLPHLLLIDDLGKRRFDRLGRGFRTQNLLGVPDHRIIQPEMLGSFFRYCLHNASFSHMYIHYTILWLHVKAFGTADGSFRNGVTFYDPAIVRGQQGAGL